MLCVLFGQHNPTCAVPSTQQGVKRAGTAQKQISHGSIQHLEEVQSGHGVWSSWDYPWLFQMWKASLWSQWMPLHISSLQGNIRRAQQGLDQLLPLSVEHCLSKCLSLLAQGNTEFCCFRLKNPPVLIALTWTLPQTWRKLWRGVLITWKRAKMLKERLLTQSWVKKSSPRLPGCCLAPCHASHWDQTHPGHDIKCKFWFEDKAPKFRYIPRRYQEILFFFQALFLILLVPMQWIQMSPSRVSHSECSAPRALSQEFTVRELITGAWLIWSCQGKC